jgi:cytidine deaminase
LITDDELYRRAKERVYRRVLSDSATAGQVASALVTDLGNIYVGVCIDTACSMGFCAEHNAIGTMITEGESAIATIVAVNGEGKILPPCGRCREFIFQVDPANMNTRVLLAGERVTTIADLLPEHWAAAW